MSLTPPTDPQSEPSEFVWNTAERLVTDELVASLAESSQQNTDLDMCGAKHSIMARNIAEDVIVDLLNAGWVAPDGTRIVTAPAAQSDTVDDTALIERAALALASGNVGDAKYRHDDAVDVHEQVYGPLLAAKDVVIERTGARRAELFVELGQARAELEKARAELAARTRDIDAVWRTYHDDLGRRNRELAAAEAELAALRARAVVPPEERQKARLDIWHALNRVRCGSVSEEHLDEWSYAVLDLIESWRPATERTTPTAPRVFRKGDPEPSDINQVKDDGDRRWCRWVRDRSWYLRDIAGPFLMWDELLDRVGLLTEVPTEGGDRG